MKELIFPNSQDIYLEVNGCKLAVVESYRARAERELYPVEAFGETEAQGMQFGRTRYHLELSRVCPCADAQGDGVDFHQLCGFHVVVNKPDRRVVYTDCQWSSITESAGLNESLVEQVTLTAGHRMELKNG